jgi:hypothetical protein
VINRKVIKQAPSLDGARVLIVPPRPGSFEFIVPIIQMVTDPGTVAAISQNLSASALYDLTKSVYSRLAGKSEATASAQMDDLARKAPGDLDALADSVSEDLVRIQRPIQSDRNGGCTIVVNGGSVGVINIINLDHDTYDYAKTKILGDQESEFFGHVRSFNGSTIQGRFWVESEERNVGFSVNKK